MLNTLGYIPIDDGREGGYRRPPRDAACIVDYFHVLNYVEDDGEFAVFEMQALMDDPDSFLEEADEALEGTEA